MHQPADPRGPAGGDDRAGALDVGGQVLRPRAGHVHLRGQVQHGVLTPGGAADRGRVGDVAPHLPARQAGGPTLQHGHLVAEQLDAYGQGRRTRFELPLAAPGSPFQRAVWEALVTIPFGETVSYGELAARLGRPGAARAVGRANATNPIALVVPCHRVIGASGALTGYAGGIELKRALLDFERGGGNGTPPFPPPTASEAQGLSRR